MDRTLLPLPLPLPLLLVVWVRPFNPDGDVAAVAAAAVVAADPLAAAEAEDDDGAAVVFVAVVLVPDDDPDTGVADAADRLKNGRCCTSLNLPPHCAAKANSTKKSAS